MEHVLSPNPLCSCRVFLAPSWHLEKFGKLKKNFFEEFVYRSPALPRSYSQEEEGKEGSEGVGDRAESQRKPSMRKVESTQGCPTSQPDPQLGFLGLLVSPQQVRKTPIKNAITPIQAHPACGTDPCSFQSPTQCSTQHLPRATHCQTLHTGAVAPVEGPRAPTS